MVTTTANVASVPGPFLAVSRSMGGTIFDVNKIIGKPKKRKKTPIEIGMISVDGGTISNSRFALESVELSEQRNVLDKKWIDGSRKWWKKIVAKSKKFDNASGEKAGKEAIAYLNGVRKSLNNLKADLWLLKGRWPELVTGDEKSDRGESFFTPNVKAAWDFENADDLIYYQIQGLEHAMEAMFDPNSMAYKSRPDMRDDAMTWGKSGDKSALDASLENISDTMAKADKIISGKMYRKLSAFVGKRGIPGKEAETEFDIGRVKVVIDYAHGNYDVDMLSRHKDLVREPGEHKLIVKAVTSAQSLVQKAGFKKAWHGRIMVQPWGKSKEFKGSSGKTYKTAGTWAHSDVISVYAPVYNRRAMREMTRIIIHEVGHRWYYKFMSKGDRARFSSWSGDVDATTEYGKEMPSEDFAEVFADYVLGENMTRAQLERFKEFALMRGKIKRQEDIEDGGVASMATGIERFLT